MSNTSHITHHTSRFTHHPSPVGDAFRAATRPIVTIIFAATIAQVVVERIDAPEWFIGLAVTVILWWFGDRTVNHIRSRGSLDPPKENK